ncbi:MAG TPA: GTP 3',8-cyclase MoaA [Anaerolineales bacterium]|nr:GTP 3',8-cyclase MoaA [Anaerolineales bacterium]HRQ93270.1 GTP 3',8-cyclase MoaA [Anaerolineales bacterium]
MNPLVDTFARPLHDLRISLTDRCNFRCTYCMPKEVFGKEHAFLPQEQLLSFDEIETLTRAFVALGVRKVRLTGGEPLMRKGLEDLIACLVAVPGIEDIALTSNGSFPVERVHSLKAAGLSRMTVSLDALDDATFKAMNDVDFPVARVLEWIEASATAGLAPIKVNMVVKRGVNEHAILPMARYFREHGHILRLIEYMDVGHSNGWRMDDVLTAKQMVAMIHAELPLEPLQANYRGEVAERYRYADGSGEIGIIASVSQPFCGDCSRARISADGRLFTCLFAIGGADLRGLLRRGADQAALQAAIAAVWQKRTDRYSELRSANTGALPKVEMSYIGG